jgi:hypothetical protein
MIKRTSRSATLLVILGAALSAMGCKDDHQAPVADMADAAAPASVQTADPNLRKPPQPQARLHPHVMKAYRVDVCYFGTMTMLHTARAYLASLGGAEPSATKIPDFGDPDPPAAAAPPTPEAIKGEPDPKAEMRRRALEARRGAVQQIPHERNARSCTVAAGLTDPPADEVDAALKALAPFSVELAKDIAVAASYYQQKGYEKDEFKQGKELHARLTEKFKKLEELHGSLGTAVAAWRQAGPPPEDPKQPLPRPEGQPEEKPDEAAVKLETEGRGLGQAAFAEARAVMWAALAGDPDVAKVKEGLEKVKTATESLKKFGEANQTDTWSKMMVPALESFLTDFTAVAEAETFPKHELKLITTATRTVEAHQRAVTRSIMPKGRGMDLGPARMGHGAPMRPGQLGPGIKQKADEPAPPAE